MMMKSLWRRRRSWPAIGIGLAMVLLALFTLASLAQAHAILIRSIPEADAELSAPPATIELWFSEPLEARFSSVILLDSTGAEIPAGASMVHTDDPTHMTLPLGDLPAGIYTVVWRTLSSVDGHEWVGSFPITILNADGSRPSATAVAVDGARRGDLPTPLEATARWISLSGALLLFGGTLFWAMVLWPFWRRMDNGIPSPGRQLLESVSRRSLSATLTLGAVALISGGWLQIGIQTISMGGFDHLPALALETRPGNLLLFRHLLVGVSLLVILSALIERGRRLWTLAAGIYTVILLALVIMLMVQTPRPITLSVFGLGILGLGFVLAQRRNATLRASSLTVWMLLIVSGVALATFSLGSHAAAVAGSGWAILGDWIHLAAAAAWLGGLLLLAVLLWVARTRFASLDAVALGGIVRGFSLLAGASVFVLAVTGLFSSVVQLPALNLLWTTPYGWVLLTKLALVALALGIGLLNNRLIHRNSAAQTPIPFGRFLRQLLSESAVGIVIVIVVAVLVQTPVPQVEAVVAPATMTSFNDIVLADDLLIHVQVSPNQVGNNRYWTHLYHSDGSPIGEVQLVRFLFIHQEADLGQSRIDLEPMGRDTFAAEGAYLNRAGPWDLSIYVRRRGMDDLLTNLTVNVPAPVGSTQDRNPWQNPVSSFPTGVVVGGLLVSLGLIPLLWWRPLRRNRRVAYPALATVGALCFVAGITLGYTAISTEASSPDLAGPPLPVTEASIASGGDLYRSRCADCHGLYGLGNGPAAAGLPVPPAVLIFHVPEHDDAELYAFIHNGFPNLGMPAFGEQLSREEIWQIVHYLRDQFGPMVSGG
ncbi:MAG: copper resistance protein CopC [Caldilineaceae bacterium]|nr:copper resistance protein CopC [Caldilineaceae bacterium]